MSELKDPLAFTVMNGPDVLKLQKELKEEIDNYKPAFGSGNSILETFATMIVFVVTCALIIFSILFPFSGVVHWAIGLAIVVIVDLLFCLCIAWHFSTAEKSWKKEFEIEDKRIELIEKYFDITIVRNGHKEYDVWTEQLVSPNNDKDMAIKCILRTIEDPKTGLEVPEIKQIAS